MFIRSEQDFLRLRREWNDLLAGSIDDVPFLRHEFLAAWWRTLGGGEWPGGDLLVTLARDEAGRLVGAAPLFRPGTAEPTTLRWVGSHEVTDYLDLLAAPENLPAFVDSWLEALERESWTALVLDNLLEDSPSIPVLEAASKKRGWSLQRERTKPCPLVRLDGGWEGYLSRLDRKQRHELRRKMRRAEAGPGGLRIRHVRQTEGLEADVDRFLSLMVLDRAKAAFLTPSMRDHFHLVATAAAEDGYLDLVFLEVEGQAAAGTFNFDYHHRIWVYNSGLDPAYLPSSPGWVLIGAVIEQAAQEGKEAVDFLRGEEDYKTRLGGIPRTIERLTITRDR
jgi:CelD/BcsL family acetyltransferase involved in cellulose biosynthesis